MEIPEIPDRYPILILINGIMVLDGNEIAILKSVVIPGIPPFPH